MRVRCSECGLGYDDAEYMTYCPHPLVGGGNYCRKHDMFNCVFCPDPPASTVGGQDAVKEVSREPRK